MQNFIKVCDDKSGKKKNHLLTPDTGLAATFGAIEHFVYVERKSGNSIPYYRIKEESYVKLEEIVNNYYCNNIIVDAYKLAQNMELLSNIAYTSKSIKFKPDLLYASIHIRK